MAYDCALKTAASSEVQHKHNPDPHTPTPNTPATLRSKAESLKPEPSIQSWGREIPEEQMLLQELRSDESVVAAVSGWCLKFLFEGHASLHDVARRREAFAQFAKEVRNVFFLPSALRLPPPLLPSLPPSLLVILSVSASTSVPLSTGPSSCFLQPQNPAP